MLIKLKELLKKHEGYRNRPYDDYDGKTIGIDGKNTIIGKLTIGVGRNIQDKGLSNDEIEYLLDNDIKSAKNDAKTATKNFDKLSSNRQDVFISMIFNLGLTRFLKFTKMLKAIEKEDWKQVKKEMLDSLWAKQVKERANELANLIEKG